MENFLIREIAPGDNKAVASLVRTTPYRVWTQ